MSNGNGQTPPPAGDSRIAGPVGEISKLLQDKAPDALDTGHPEPELREPKPPAKPQGQTPEETAAQEAEQAAADATEPEQTAAEIAEADAPTDADGEPKHDTEIPVEGLSFKEIAERLGVPARKLYEDLQIPLQDGKGGTATIGELKDMTQRVATLDADREAFTTERDTWQNDVMAARSEMGTAVEVVSNALVQQFGQTQGRAIMAEAVEIARQGNLHRAAEARARLFERFPTWKDDQVRKAIRDRMVAHLAPFHFTPQAVDSIDDPGTLVYIHANMMRDEKIATARAKLEPARTPGKQRAPAARRRGPSKAALSKQQLTTRAKETGAREDILAGIGSILSASKD